jgi:hypothetical protein
MNIVLIPCIRGLSKDLGVNYEDWENLSRCALISYNSAVIHIKDADQVIMFHQNLQISSIQSVEKAILQKVLSHHKIGDNVLLLEADTICINDIYLNEFPQDKLQLFALIGRSDFPERINDNHYQNSGVVYLPKNANKLVTKIISDAVKSKWPARWAYYQLIWNEAYYSQFQTPEEGSEKTHDSGIAEFNLLIDSKNFNLKAQNAKIIHLFTSKGSKRARKMAEKLYNSRFSAGKRNRVLRSLGKNHQYQTRSTNIIHRILSKLLL